MGWHGLAVDWLGMEWQWHGDADLYLRFQTPPPKCPKSRPTNFNPSVYTIISGGYWRLNALSRSKNDLSKQLAELKNELLTLRVQKIAGGSASKLTKMCASFVYGYGLCY